MAFFDGFWRFGEGQGGLDEQVISEIDRVRRALSGTLLRFLESGRSESRSVFLKV